MNQKLPGRKSGDNFKKTPKMMWSQTSLCRLRCEIPRFLRMVSHLRHQMAEILFLIRGQSRLGKFRFMELQQQIFIKQYRTRRSERRRAAQQLHDSQHGIEKTVRIGDFPNRIFQVERQKSAFHISPDPFAVRTKKTVIPRLSREVSVFKKSPGMSDERICPLILFHRPVIQRKVKPPGVVVLHPIVNRDMARLPLMIRRRIVKTENMSVKKVHQLSVLCKKQFLSFILERLYLWYNIYISGKKTRIGRKYQPDERDISMEQMKIAAQLYSFRDYIKTPAGVRDTLRRLRQIGFSAVQLSSSIAPMPEEELRRMLQEEGMIAPTSHERAKDLIEKPEQTIEHLLALDCHHTAYPYPEWIPTGKGEAVAFAKELNQAAEKFRRAGIDFAYHNHAIEFLRFEGSTLLELIYRNAPLVSGELDTFWVQKGGGDPVDWISRLNGRIKVLHIKDFGVNQRGETIMMPIGSGNLDWKRIFTAAETAGVEYYVVEHDGDCADPFESFAASMRFLKGNFVS